MGMLILVVGSVLCLLVGLICVGGVTLVADVNPRCGG